MQLSEWAQDMLRHLAEHRDTEREALREYEGITERCGGRVAYLARLILEDERRHHQLYVEMENAIRSELEGRPYDPRLPEDRGAVQDCDGLREQTRHLIEFERADLKDLRDLRAEVTKVEDTKWWTALLDLMERDTEKHIRLLQAIDDMT